MLKVETDEVDFVECSVGLWLQIRRRDVGLDLYKSLCQCQGYCPPVTGFPSETVNEKFLCLAFSSLSFVSPGERKLEFDSTFTCRYQEAFIHSSHSGPQRPSCW